MSKPTSELTDVIRLTADSRGALRASCDILCILMSNKCRKSSTITTSQIEFRFTPSHISICEPFGVFSCPFKSDVLEARVFVRGIVILIGRVGTFLVTLFFSIVSLTSHVRLFVIRVKYYDVRGRWNSCGRIDRGYNTGRYWRRIRACCKYLRRWRRGLREGCLWARIKDMCAIRVNEGPTGWHDKIIYCLPKTGDLRRRVLLTREISAVFIQGIKILNLVRRLKNSDVVITGRA